MDFRALIVLMMSAVLVNNYVLRQFLGICPFLGVSKDTGNAVGMGAAIITVMLVATAITWPIHSFLLSRHGLEYLQTIVFILVIAAIVQFIEIFLKKHIPSLHSALGVYLPLITTNCAVLGVTIANIGKDHSFIQSLVYSFGAGIGFFLAMVIFSGVRAHTEAADPPEAFKGLPITLISAAILSMAFFAFDGVIENMFG